MDYISLITQVGFPIACCTVLFIQNNEMQKTLSQLSTTLALLADRLLDIEAKMKYHSDLFGKGRIENGQENTSKE